jgi:hypothetical protein
VVPARSASPAAESAFIPPLSYERCNLLGEGRSVPGRHLASVAPARPTTASRQAMDHVCWLFSPGLGRNAGLTCAQDPARTYEPDHLGIPKTAAPSPAMVMIGLAQVIDGQPVAQPDFHSVREAFRALKLRSCVSRVRLPRAPRRSAKSLLDQRDPAPSERAAKPAHSPEQPHFAGSAKCV